MRSPVDRARGAPRWDAPRRAARPTAPPRSGALRTCGRRRRSRWRARPRRTRRPPSPRRARALESTAVRAPTLRPAEPETNESSRPARIGRGYRRPDRRPGLSAPVRPAVDTTRYAPPDVRRPATRSSKTMTATASSSLTAPPATDPPESIIRRIAGGDELPAWFSIGLTVAIVWCATAGITAMVLLDQKRYSPWTCAIVATGAALASLPFRARPRGRTAHGPAIAAVAIALVLLGTAAAFHSERLLTDRDPGVYLNTGRSIARTHLHSSGGRAEPVRRGGDLLAPGIGFRDREPPDLLELPQLPAVAHGAGLGGRRRHRAARRPGGARRARAAGALRARHEDRGSALGSARARVAHARAAPVVVLARRVFGACAPSARAGRLVVVPRSAPRVRGRRGRDRRHRDGGHHARTHRRDRPPGRGPDCARRRVAARRAPRPAGASTPPGRDRRLRGGLCGKRLDRPRGGAAPDARLLHRPSRQAAAARARAGRRGARRGRRPRRPPADRRSRDSGGAEQRGARRRHRRRPRDVVLRVPLPSEDRTGTAAASGRTAAHSTRTSRRHRSAGSRGTSGR